MRELLMDNVGLIVGLGFAALVLGLKYMANKTKTDLDDKAVAAVEKNKETIVAVMVKLVKKMLGKKKAK